MRLTLLFTLLYSVSLMSQDLEFENVILKANQIYPLRFEADSIKTCFFIVEARKTDDLLKFDEYEDYEDNDLNLIDNLIALSREGALSFYKANELNYFIGSPMTVPEIKKRLNLNDEYQIGLSIEDYIFRTEEYYLQGISGQQHLLVIGPLTNKNDQTQVLFWVHLYDLYDYKTIQKLNTKDCTVNQTFYKNIDY